MEQYVGSTSGVVEDGSGCRADGRAYFAFALCLTARRRTFEEASVSTLLFGLVTYHIKTRATLLNGFNMVLQQCLACNAVVTESCKTCVCGHVFEDAKEIGGKRFSEYRAELYSRLENRRIKQLTRQNRKANEKESGRQPLKERKANAVESGVIVTSTFKPKPHSLGSRTFHRRIKGKRLSRPVNASPSKTAVPPELVSRLPSALQEINRKLTGQNLLWWTMQLQ
ncbi:hypothetical protein OS493_017816 [Desmophyllum pertusum]|uniref:Uncharacterized protein n=1 Tax=Desmophyllum pertusum TaxID=174260 RepID=A0A9X0CYR1_9CNID|nr:hypothetical protein OS493_017816 [Desmophyllum pertusum]